MRAACLIRDQPGYRREAFVAGLARCGIVATAEPDPSAHLLVIWNRYGSNDDLARRFERAGKPVIVAENGYLGRDWRAGHWYTLALSHHNGPGRYPTEGGPERWDAFGVPLAPMREPAGNWLVLAQRGIGGPGVAQPPGWPEAAVLDLRKLGERARLRAHPGEHAPRITLDDDLRGVGCAVTWGSGAALKAMLAGVRVLHGLPRWIGRAAAQHWQPSLIPPPPATDGRLAMFRALAWTIWECEEIAAGIPFQRLLTHFETSLEPA